MYACDDSKFQDSYALMGSTWLKCWNSIENSNSFSFSVSSKKASQFITSISPLNPIQTTRWTDDFHKASHIPTGICGKAKISIHPAELNNDSSGDCCGGDPFDWVNSSRWCHWWWWRSDSSWDYNFPEVCPPAELSGHRVWWWHDERHSALSRAEAAKR